MRHNSDVQTWLGMATSHEHRLRCQSTTGSTGTAARRDHSAQPPQPSQPCSPSDQPFFLLQYARLLVLSVRRSNSQVRWVLWHLTVTYRHLYTQMLAIPAISRIFSYINRNIWQFIANHIEYECGLTIDRPSYHSYQINNRLLDN